MAQPYEDAEPQRRPPGGRRSLADRAYYLIKRKILSTAYPPGYQVMEQELAESLGMSRTPVREAMVRLEEEGLCRIFPRRGMRVNAFSAEDMREIYELLCCLEAKAVENVARREPKSGVLSKLDRAVARMEAALEADDLERWAAADARFHKLIFELCGNRRLGEMGMSLLEQAHRVRMFTLRLRQKPFRSTSDHRALIERIRDGDAQGARELNWHHREQAGAELLALLKRYQLKNL